MNTEKFHINADWKEFLKEEINSNYFNQIIKKIKKERKIHTVFPEDHQIFKAFNTTALKTLKVIIIGQDPYHSKGQAEGLCFSVPESIPPPPSLKNIFLELAEDLKIPKLNHGSLISWAQQGVLLLNSTLTVREKEAGSHKEIGWEYFTDKIIQKIAERKTGIIFLLWGSFAQKKSILINEKKHYILNAAHPSPLSAYKGFFGCRHFSKTNKILAHNKQKPINWNTCSKDLPLF